jgi:toxin ParE1/3/4
LKLCWAERASDDLIAIQRHIAQDKPAAARTWIARLRQRARRAADAPWAGRIVPEFGQPHIREVFLGSYRIGLDRLTILTVFEGHRLMRGPE